MLVFLGKSSYLCAKNKTKIKVSLPSYRNIFGTMIIGYCRVSTQDQCLDRQTDILTDAGCERIYQEKISGGTKERPELQRMIETLREGDTVVVTELSRLSRTVKDLFSLVERIHHAGANLKSLKENWADTTTPQGKLLFAVFAGISEFERDLIRQRTKEGLEAARARGRNGGRPKADSKQIDNALKMYQSKDYGIEDILKATGISKTTLYRYLNRK